MTPESQNNGTRRGNGWYTTQDNWFPWQQIYNNRGTVGNVVFCVVQPQGYITKTSETSQVGDAA
jgi:hypothetical protein